MINTKDILDVLPQNIRTIINGYRNVEQLQEIRMKVNKPLIFQVGNAEIIHEFKPTLQDIRAVLQKMSNYSIYAFEEELKQGYITIKGGHRVGICGSCVIEDGRVKTIKDIASLNIRVCNEIIGCSEPLVQFILDKDSIRNTIIISPPKCGKTTLIRDISRVVSDGIKKIGYKGKKVCVVDERSEIGACFNGIPQMNVGIRTDILDGCPKSEGIMMAIRSMSPDVIICDEIGTHKDMESILAALNSGVSLITTIHGYGIEDLFNRAVFKDIVDNNVFKRAIVLSTRKGAGTVEYIYDFSNKSVIWRGEYA